MRTLGKWSGDPVIGLGMALLCAYYVISPGVFQSKASGDGWFGFNYLRAIFEFHTIDMHDVLPNFVQFFGVSGPGHHMPNRCPFGPVFVWTPFYLVALGVQWLGQHAHVVAPGDASSRFVAWLTGLGTLAGVLVGWRQLYLLVARYVGRTAARIGSIAAVWATPIAWYAATQPFYQHGLAFGFVAILVERWDRTRGDASAWRFLWLGLIGGLAATMREQEALFLLLPGVEALYFTLRGPQRLRWLVGGVVLSVAFVVAFMPQLLVWRYYTGSMLTPAQVEPLRWSTPFVIVSLFSTRGGLFPWSPIAYAATLGLCFVATAPRARVLALGLLGVFALELYVVSSAWVLTGGYGFGARRLSDCAVLIALGVGLLWARVSPSSEGSSEGPSEAGSPSRARPWGRRLVAGFVVLCLGLNVWAMELMRAYRIASSGAYARSAQRFLEDVHAPRFVSRFFGAVGYPFVQPAGWIFALWHHAPASAFEGVVGNFFLDRDGQWMQIQTRALAFERDARPYVIAGLDLTQKPARVTGPMRMLVPVFAREPVSVHMLGLVPPTNLAGEWNGVPLQPRADASGIRFVAPCRRRCGPA
jgi:hypothetical protein